MLFELFNNKCNGQHLVSTYLCLPLRCIFQKHHHLISVLPYSRLQIISQKTETQRG